MTIEAGALALRITEVGGDAVEQKLASIDRKATALGAKTVTVPVRPPTASDLTLIDRQLEQMGKQIPLYKQGAQFASTKAGALRELGSVETQLRGIIAGSNTTLEQRIGAEKQLAQLTAGAPQRIGAMTSALKMLGTLGIALTIGEIVSGIVNMTRAAIDAGDALHDLSMRSGVSVESLSVLLQVAEKSGANAQIVGVGFRNLSREVEKLRDGNKGATEAFAALGLTAADFAGLSIEQVFMKVADAQAKLGDGSEKTAAMLQIFGRAGDQLIPMLNELADGGFDKARERAEALGGVVSADFAAKADTFNESVTDMQTALGGLVRVVVEDSLPWMTAMADKLTDLIVRSKSWIGVLVDAAVKAGALMLFGPGAAGMVGGSAPPGQRVDNTGVTFTPTMSPEARAAQLALLGSSGAATTTRTALTAAQREAAEAARIQRSLDRMRVAAPGVTGVIGQSQVGDLLSRIPLVGVDSKGKMKGESAFGLGDVVDADFDALEAKIRERQEQLSGIVIGVGNTIGDAMASGFRAAFSGGNFFAEMGKALLVGIGNMIVQLGSAMLTYGLLMAVGLPLLIATPFAASALSAPAAIAAGTGLIALGAGMGAIAGGGGKGGGGGSNARPAPPREQDDNQWSVAFDPDRKLRKGAAASAVAPSVRPIASGPMPEARPVVHIGVLNALHPDDPRWQREIAATYKNARDRGLIRNAG